LISINVEDGRMVSGGAVHPVTQLLAWLELRDNLRRHLNACACFWIASYARITFFGVEASKTSQFDPLSSPQSIPDGGKNIIYHYFSFSSGDLAFQFYNGIYQF